MAIQQKIFLFIALVFLLLPQAVVLAILVPPQVQNISNEPPVATERVEINAAANMANAANQANSANQGSQASNNQKEPSNNCQQYCSDIKKFNPPAGTACFCNTGPKGLTDLINRITKYMLWVALFGAPLVVIFGAFMIATARDNPEQVGKGRAMIVWAMIGLAVFLVAKILGNVIISAFGGS